MPEVEATSRLLKKGITGFGDPVPPPLLTDLRLFRAHCYEAARCCQARVVETSERKTHFVWGNYAISTFVVTRQTIDLLINLHHPVIAFAEAGPIPLDQIRFRDCLELAWAFREFGNYQLGPAIYWESKVTAESLCDLSDAELSQVAYWKPQRLGDIVFNLWD